LAKGKPHLALSHGSRSQVIAAKMLGIRSVVITDYEHAKGIAIIRPNVLIVPEVVAATVDRSLLNRTRTYPGIKEDVYVPDFRPDKKILESLGLHEEWILVTIRPPATEAHYHNPESEILFNDVVEFLGSQDKLQMVLLPRNEKKQGDFIKERWSKWCSEKKIIIPEKVVDGLNLIWHSDLVVSGGGTMNREAAALGVPVYSIFRGKIGAVDHYLEKTGRLVMIGSPDEVRQKICVRKRAEGRLTDQLDRPTLTTIVDIVEQEIREQFKH
jgi:predicted glycosyltransferase